MSKAIFGKTQGLKASQHKRLERLLTKSATQKSVCPPELARALCECAADTGRMVGLLCDRRGGVAEVALGEPTRLYLPDVGRLRAAAGRLRGLRLLVARPARSDGSFAIDHDLITDLERLKLDCVLEVEALDDGRCGRCALAHLLPAAVQDRQRELRHNVDSFHHPSDVNVDFATFIAELEGELVRTAEGARAAAKVPGERDVAVLVGVWKGNG
jgi:GTP-binding protein HflX